MPKLRNDALDWEVPIDYFLTKPKFRPGYVPYTDNPVKVVDDAGKVITGAKVESDGSVSGLAKVNEG